MTDNFQRWILEGHFRLAGYSPLTGEHRVFVDKHNKIMYPAAEIVARGLAGQANSAVTHLYLAYNNNDAYPAGGYTIAANTTSMQKNAVSGYLRLPITLPPTITASSDASGSYQLLNYTVLVSQPGSSFIVTDSPSLISGTSDFYEAALVCQTSPDGSISNVTGDRMLARLAFERFPYDQTLNLSISWAIKLSVYL